MNESRACPQCQQPLAHDAPDGLCPACLMKVAMGSQPEPGATVVVGAADRPQRRLPGAGEQFGGYRIVRELGRGGMGAVYDAEDVESGRRVALKVLTHQLDSPEARARFLREGRLAASINHPNSVYVFGTEEIDGTPVIAMELVAGGTLQERVERNGPLPSTEAVDVVLQVIAGLEAAQAIGVLHRDIKPANCFEDADGTVKVGDFGLSISTAARAETNLTIDGSFLGTPAFCSPEQLRGDELSVRSDIYAVGVTLFYLLTGRTPFEGRNVVQLLANAIEQPPPSPRKLRREVPQGLANAVLRCLEKQPGERFKSYAELRQVLSPFSSDAPASATLALRLVAGLLDMTLVSVVTMSISMGALGGMAMFFDAGGFRSQKFVTIMVTSFIAWVLYYAVTEGRWGASAGKAICRLRVIGRDRNPPGMARAALRAFLFLVPPVLPYWVLFAGDPRGFLNAGSDLLRFAGSLGYYVILALLFSTARRRNGFAGIHDLLSRSRVIRRTVRQERPALVAAEAEPVTTQTAAKVGPYHVLEPLGRTPEWMLGYDTRLLRKVWIRVVAPGTPSVQPELRNLGRIGRLRWISGRRSADENWDAFEGISGKALPSLLETPQPWSSVRFWLLDLANELAAAERDGTMPPALALDRVWITGEGRAKLLDFTAPTLGADSPPAVGVASPVEFLASVARAALAGKSDDVPGSSSVRRPMPLHARSFIDGMARIPRLADLVTTLKPLTQRLATVSRARRAALVAGCVAFPVFAAAAAMFGFTLVETWQRTQPDVSEMAQLLSIRGMQQMPWVPARQRVPEKAFAVYIATHYAGTIKDTNKWNTLYALSMIPGEKRLFAERAVEQHAGASEAEIKQAVAAVQPILGAAKMPQVTRESWFPLFVVGITLAIYVAIPALIAALLFRGGLILLASGVVVVRKDGVRASRVRVLWRSMLAWAPLFGALMLGMAMSRMVGAWAAALFVTALLAIAAFVSVWLPERGLQDRLAGTRLVPR